MGTWHKDPRHCYIAVLDAIFYAGLETLERKLPAHAVERIYYAENWEDATNFQADIYLDISPVFDKWIQACAIQPGPAAGKATGQRSGKMVY